jgi:hypothetical protein
MKKRARLSDNITAARQSSAAPASAAPAPKPAQRRDINSFSTGD